MLLYILEMGKRRQCAVCEEHVHILAEGEQLLIHRAAGHLPNSGPESRMEGVDTTPWRSWWLGVATCKMSPSLQAKKRGSQTVAYAPVGEL